MDLHYEIIIKGFLAGWFITAFTPFQDWLNNFKTNKLILALGCHKCMSLWSTITLGFIITYSFLPWEALIASLGAMIFDKVINSFKIYL